MGRLLLSNARVLDGLEGEGCLSTSICMGFPPADTPVCGPAVLAYAAEPMRAQVAVDRLAAAFGSAEPHFAGRLWEPEAAVAHAMHADHEEAAYDRHTANH